MRPVLDDERAIELGLDPIQDEALKVNGKTREELENAPDTKLVWESFCQFVNRYNYKKDIWNAPIAAGFNIDAFDNIIVNRLCGHEPYGFGPWDEEYRKNKIFHPIFAIDVMDYCWMWFENIKMPTRSLGMDAMRDYFGMSKEGAHDAKQDVIDCSEILIRFLRLSRSISPKVKFQDSCNKSILKI